MNKLNFDESEVGEIDIPEIPEYILDEMASESAERIHDKLNEKASEINNISINDQQLRELRGILNPVGPSEIVVRGKSVICKKLNQIAVFF